MGYLGTKPSVATSLADNIVTADKIATGAVTDPKIAAMAASKLTGQVADANIAAVAASKLTQGFSTNGFVDIGNIRIQWLTLTSTASPFTGAAPGPGAMIDGIVSYPASFKSGTLPIVMGSIATEYHDVQGSGLANTDYSNTQFRYIFSCYRSAGIASRKMNFIAIGEKP